MQAVEKWCEVRQGACNAGVRQRACVGYLHVMLAHDGCTVWSKSKLWWCP